MLVALLLGSYGGPNVRAAEMSRSEILKTFTTYNKLNEEFVASSRSARPLTEGGISLRKRVKHYAEGPFQRAVSAAEFHVCASEDAEILNALLNVTRSTSNSADELPALTLGRIFICRPEAVERSFSEFSAPQRRELYKTLQWGFESAVYGKSGDRILSLRRKLQSMATK